MSPRSQVSESPTDEVRVKTASRLSLSKAAKSYVVVVQRFFRGLLLGSDIRSEAAEVQREHLFRCVIEFLHWLPGNFIFDSSFYDKMSQLLNYCLGFTF